MKKVECVKLLLLLPLVIITPLLSTSLRFKYLYLIVNILIIALGADAGLLSFFLHSPKPPPFHVLPHKPPPIHDHDHDVAEPADQESPSHEKMSIFYIHQDDDDDQLMDDDQMIEDDDVEDHELFHKAETFIGNFYKQLKMQRQESWNN